RFVTGSSAITRDGRSASSRSKNRSSTAVASREKTLKFTPSRVTVAPRAALRRSISMPPPVNARSPLAEQRFGLGNHPPGLEAEFALQLLERCGGAEGLHANHPSGRTDVAFPSECGALFDREPRRHIRRQDGGTILRRLVLEDLPRRHRDDARADSLRHQL